MEDVIMKAMILTMAAAALLCGCSTVNTFERAKPEGTMQMVNDKRIITDGGLDDYAYVASINQSRVGGLLKIQAKLVNSSSANRKIRYKFSWFDASGMESGGVTADWRVLELEGGEARHISAVATNPNAVDFSLKLLPDER